MEPVTALSPIPSKSNHLALIGGLPCSVTYFAAELCRDLLARKHGACEVIALNDLSEATLEKIAAIDLPAMFLSEIPDAAVVEALSQSDFPILIIDQRVSDASRDFMAAREAKLLDTVRTIARAQIGLGALLEIPRGELVAADQAQSAADLARQIARACDVDEMLAQRMIDERQLDRFYTFHPERAASPWHMPVDLLVEAAPPYLPATDPLNLLGPARCLTIGPYLYLPSGDWKGVLTFTSSSNRSTNTIGFDVTADEEIKLEENFEISVDGKFSIELHFRISDPYYPFEFRTHLRRGAIDGELRLHSLALERRG